MTALWFDFGQTRVGGGNVKATAKVKVDQGEYKWNCSQAKKLQLHIDFMWVYIFRVLRPLAQYAHILFPCAAQIY